MPDIKSIFASRTILTNILIGLTGVGVAVGALPDACGPEAVATNLGAAVPTILGSILTGLAVISSYFRVKATTTLV
jgi:hypothetical protein